MDTNTVTTEAGLIVPAAAIERKRRVLPADTFKVMRRFVRGIRAERIRTLLMCEDCDGPISLHLEDQLAPGIGGNPVFRCKCSDRVVR